MTYIHHIVFITDKQVKLLHEFTNAESANRKLAAISGAKMFEHGELCVVDEKTLKVLKKKNKIVED